MTASNDISEAKAFMKKAAEYGSVLGLSSVKDLLEKLNNPQNELSIIHVAGTNGKGSVCAYLTSVLTEAGYKVGTYTSPAVFDERERYTICNQWISQADYAAYILRIKEACALLVKEKKPHPTIFEIETALALLYFKENNCNPVILEVGMGGATDATNVADKVLCAVFASIGVDHMGFLGNSLEEIATVKAGIIKPGCPVVSIWQQDGVERVLCAEAERKNASLHIAKLDNLQVCSVVENTFNYADFPQITLSMKGSYQIDNAVLALETINILRGQGYRISDKAVQSAMKNTNWQGRMEQIFAVPPIFIDGAHNLPAAIRLAETIKNSFTNKRLTFIMGVLADKQYEQMLEVLGEYCNHFIAVTPANPRALSAEALAQKAQQLGLLASHAAPDLEVALQQAFSYNDDVILAFGSLSYLAEFKKVVNNHKENNVV